jgi:hypothetical protein
MRERGLNKGRRSVPALAASRPFQRRGSMKLRHLAVLSLGFVVATPAFAQEKKDAAPPQMSAEQKAMMEAWQKAATPNEKHKQLISEFEGTWTRK